MLYFSSRLPFRYRLEACLVKVVLPCFEPLGAQQEGFFTLRVVTRVSILSPELLSFAFRL